MVSTQTRWFRTKLPKPLPNQIILIRSKKEVIPEVFDYSDISIKVSRLFDDNIEELEGCKIYLDSIHQLFITNRKNTKGYKLAQWSIITYTI
jgi:hypothetical protein